MEVVLEMLRLDQWRRLGGVGEAEPPGSLSWTVAGHRDVYMFGFYEGVAGVWRSTGGIDTANAVVRDIISEGVEKLSDLAQPFVLPSDDRGIRVRMRLIS